MKKSILNTVLGLFLFSLSLQAQKKVFYFSIDAEIDTRTSRKTQLALEKATASKADIVLLELNTYGGAVNDADKIRTLLLNAKMPVWVFINKNAASAGALIAIACDSIYMADGANIGAATVVNGNDGMPVPEKYQSYMRSMMRSTAETNGRNPKIAEAFVDPDIILDTNIKKIGKVLTLTTSEAIKAGFCDKKLNSVDEILSINGISAQELEKFELTLTEKIIAFFINPAISSILILIIIGGIYFELQTPGVGFPIAASVVAAVLYFIPYYLNGLAAYWELGLFIVGLGLIGLEIFVIPGFGITGVSGIVIAFGALGLMMLGNNQLDFSSVSEAELAGALWPVFIGLISSVVVIILGFKVLSKSTYFKEVTLDEKIIKPLPYSEDVDLQLIGKEGISVTSMRPIGRIKVENRIYEATTNGQYIAEQTNIKIVSLHGNTVIVEPI